MCWPRWLRWGPAAAPGRPIHAGQVLGETLAGGGRYLLAVAGTGAAVVNVDAALAGRPALAGLLPVGRVPREMAPEPGGRTLLVTNFDAGQVELVNVAGLP